MAAITVAIVASSQQEAPVVDSTADFPDLSLSTNEVAVAKRKPVRASAPRASTGRAAGGRRSKEDPLDGWTLCETTDDAEGWVVLSTSGSDGDDDAARKAQDLFRQAASEWPPEDEEESDAESEAEEQELRPNGSEFDMPSTVVRPPPKARQAPSTADAKAAAAKVAAAQKKKDLTRAARKNLWRQRTLEQMAAASDIEGAGSRAADLKAQRSNKRRDRRMRGDVD